MAYATLDPNNCSTNIVLSNGNLTASCSSGGVVWNLCKSTGPFKLWGKWYWEVHIDTASTNLMPGTSDPTIGLESSYCGQTLTTYGYWTNGRFYNNGGYGSGATYTTNDTIMFAFDLDNRKGWIGKNGVWQG